MDLYILDLFKPSDSIKYWVATNAKGEFIMLKLNEEKLGKWYDGVDFENSHLVTNKNHNTDLGISGIILRKPNSTGSNGRVFASAIINFTNGLSVNGSVYVDKSLTGLTFGVTQTEKNADGERYDINVRVPMSIQAQVLRYATTKAVEVATAPAPTQPASAQNYAQNYAPQPPVAQPPVQSAPTQNFINPSTGLPMTVEEITAMMNQGRI